MQLWPIDVINEVFYYIPSEAPKLAKVCKRFRNAVDADAFWALRLKTRFNIKTISGRSYKDYYKLCFAGMLKLKSPILPESQLAEGSFIRSQNGNLLKIVHRIDDQHTLELDNNALRLKRGFETLELWVLIPSNYTLEWLSNRYWIVRSDAATYLFNLDEKSNTLLGPSRIDVFIRQNFLFTIGNTTLNVHDRRTRQLVFSGIIHFNNKRHIFYLSEEEMVFITQQNQLILISSDFYVYPMPVYFEPQARLNETQLIVERDLASFIFDLKTLKLTALDLGAFSFKSNLSIAFHQSGVLTIYDISSLKRIASYKIPFNYNILKIDDRFVLLKPVEDTMEMRSQFRILSLLEQNEFDFHRRKMTFIGSEAFFLLFARLNGNILDIICLNALTYEFFTPVRSIQNFQFSAATKICPLLKTDDEDYLVVSYQDYKIRVKTVLRSMNGEIKINTYQYHY